MLLIQKTRSFSCTVKIKQFSCSSGTIPDADKKCSGATSFFCSELGCFSVLLSLLVVSLTTPCCCSMFLFRHGAFDTRFRWRKKQLYSVSSRRVARARVPCVWACTYRGENLVLWLTWVCTQPPTLSALLLCLLFCFVDLQLSHNFATVIEKNIEHKCAACWRARTCSWRASNVKFFLCFQQTKSSHVL